MFIGLMPGLRAGLAAIVRTSPSIWFEGQIVYST